MLPVLAVLHAEDVALEFVSVLARHPDDDVHVLVGTPPAALVLPGGLPLRERLDLLAPYVEPGRNTAAPPAPEQVAAALDALPDPVVWTHSPADHRMRRARHGWTVARTAGAALCSAGDSAHLQVLADQAAALTPAEAAAKIEFVVRHGADLLASRVADRLVTTERVPSVERFFRVDAGQADRLYALTASLGEDAALADDPWEFRGSPYEMARLDATAAWVARWCVPEDGPVVEVGACQGALTARLLAKGYEVRAAEPNPLFRARLEREHGVAALPDSLEDLAAHRRWPAKVYLLGEMLYYGQDLDVLHDLPAEVLLISLAEERMADTIWPWVREQDVWRVAERRELAPPALEQVCDGLAYVRKRGSRGLALTRNGAR
ncbi:hypothetical protein [Nonomuraea endophytica]|uniref:Uncharacterized protein n=1 Tax=Nonomuraea endophytica TaxID=714136 RepID=A0A7W8EI79_9ACTN|nr:hypothetical protein [Nonomuraea endophytica]MBB5080364.1 hypothetical protein [Nonomuraea endophytica]